MKKLSKWSINNWAIISCIIIILILTVHSFYKYIDEYYGYDYEIEVSIYYNNMEECNKKYESWCDTLEYPPTPREEFKKLDAKTLYFEVICHYFTPIVFLLPLFIIIIIVSKLHKEFSSGAIKNHLMRESFKEYKRKLDKTIIKISLLLPLCIFLIFIISCLLTRFNFKVDERVYPIAVYNSWNYNNFSLYIILHYVTLFFACIFYGNISLCFMNKHKNSFVVSLLSYISFFAVGILFLILEYFVVRSPLSYYSKYLNTADFWVVQGFAEIIGKLILAIVLALITFGIKELIYKNKEKVIIENEKEII